MRLPMAGGPPETILEEPFAQAARSDFSCPREPGRSCVLNEWQGDNFVLYSFDPMHGKGAELGKIATSGADPRKFLGWEVSPDGSQVALVDSSRSIHVFNLAARKWHDIAVQPSWGEIQTIAWAADGESFFVTTWLPESFNLVRVGLSGKAQLLLNNGHRQWLNGPRPSPDGKYLAFQAQTWDSNVWVLTNY